MRRFHFADFISSVQLVRLLALARMHVHVRGAAAAAVSVRPHLSAPTDSGIT
jgi:hypothetical protein